MFLRLVLRNSVLHLKGGLAVALAAAAASAVLIGAAIVGDSVNGSLKDTALERLGGITHSVTAPYFFDEGLSGRIESGLNGGTAAPVLILYASVKNISNGVTAQNVQIVGCDERFFELFGVKFDEAGGLTGRKALVSRSLSKDIIFLQNDNIILTLPKAALAPQGSVFGKKKTADTTVTLRLEPGMVMPSYSAGLFNLKNEAAPSRTVFVPLKTLQNALGLTGKINTVLIHSEKTNPAMALNQKITLGDFGLSIVEDNAGGAFYIESGDLMLTEAQAARAEIAAKKSGLSGERLSVYLVRSINGKAPYSVIAASEKTSVGKYQILLSGWAAEDAGKILGEALPVSFIKAKSDGDYYEASEEFVFSGKMPDAYANSGLVPKFEGITDSASMADWKPPFALVKGAIRPKDEKYWTEHGAAPKALINYKRALQYWKEESPVYSGITSCRVEKKDADSRKRFENYFTEEGDPAAMGLILKSEREDAQKSAVASSDYSSLFAGLSFFVVASALGLVWLIFGLMAEERSKEAGIMLALGFKPRYIIALLSCEGAVYALAGAVPGILLGLQYAKFFTRYLAAGWKSSGVELATFSVHLDPLNIFLWALIAFLLSVAAASFSASRVIKEKVTALLSGSSRLPDVKQFGRTNSAVLIAACAGAAVSILLIALGAAKALSAEAAFFTGGTILLASLLAFFSLLIKNRRAESRLGLALRSIYAGRKKSILAASLIASAAFLLVTVSSNKKAPEDLDVYGRASGSGGFNITASSGLPVNFDLNTKKGRAAAGIKDDAVFAGFSALSFPVKAGEDMSCLNVAAPKEPAVYGVPGALIERGGFTVSAPGFAGNGWKALEAPLKDAIPAFADSNSLEWILHKKVGDEIYSGGKKLKISGTVNESVFAGALLVSEKNFRANFTGKGNAFFLAACPPEKEKEVLAVLNRDLSDQGFDARRTSEYLMKYAGIQNIYISTFEFLGGLGFLLGILGLTGVMLRNIRERTRELAVMNAFGYSPHELVRLILVENALLLTAGLIIGTLAALAAVYPQTIALGRSASWTTSLAWLLPVYAAGLLASIAGAAFAIGRTTAEALRKE